MKPAIVDREFAEKFMRSVDRPLDYGVYQLFHEWWETAPQSAIDEYAADLAAQPGAREFIAERYLSEPLSLDGLAACAPDTLGHGYRSFIVDNDLAANLARDYREFNQSLTASGKLDRMPEDMSYMIVRGFQIHDFLHVLSGHNPTPVGEIGMAAFHFAQLRYPYHAMRMAVVTAYTGFVSPRFIGPAMDAMAAGWTMGRRAENLHFTRWEDELHTPLESLREKYNIDVSLGQMFAEA